MHCTMPSLHPVVYATLQVYISFSCMVIMIDQKAIGQELGHSDLKTGDWTDNWQYLPVSALTGVLRIA